MPYPAEPLAHHTDEASTSMALSCTQAPIASRIPMVSTPPQSTTSPDSGMTSGLSGDPALLVGQFRHDRRQRLLGHGLTEPAHGRLGQVVAETLRDRRRRRGGSRQRLTTTVVRPARGRPAGSARQPACRQVRLPTTTTTSSAACRQTAGRGPIRHQSGSPGHRRHCPHRPRRRGSASGQIQDVVQRTRVRGGVEEGSSPVSTSRPLCWTTGRSGVPRSADRHASSSPPSGRSSRSARAGACTLASTRTVVCVRETQLGDRCGHGCGPPGAGWAPHRHHRPPSAVARSSAARRPASVAPSGGQSASRPLTHNDDRAQTRSRASARPGAGSPRT